VSRAYVAHPGAVNGGRPSRDAVVAGRSFRAWPRERQILAWVGRGKTNPQIAEILWIAPTTVRRHLEHIYAKLGVHTRTAAATRLLGILDDEGQQ
jgi:DNA-binding CsgD family transcriptional regulator